MGNAVDFRWMEDLYMRTEKEIFKAALALPYQDRLDILMILLADLRKHDGMVEKVFEKRKRSAPAAKVKSKNKNRKGGRS